MNIRPCRNLALVEIIPRRDEITDYKIVDGQFIDLSETPAPVNQVVALRQWHGLDSTPTIKYEGERTMPRLRRARVIEVGPRVTDIRPGDTVLVGVFAGLEAGLDDRKDIRWIQESEVQLVETSP